MPYTYAYPRPALTVDCVIFGHAPDGMRVLLIERAQDPYAGCWALPGGFVEMEETLEAAARRELAEETGVHAGSLLQLHAFGDPGRDPRGRTVSVVYYALVDPARHPARAASDARNVAWFPADAPPPLAFDHARILALACARLLRQGVLIEQDTPAPDGAPRYRVDAARYRALLAVEGADATR